MGELDGAPIRYAPTTSGYLAYQTVGEGPIDLLRVDEMTMVSIDALDDEPHSRRFDAALASFVRLIRFDRRGIGLSDAYTKDAPPTLEQAARDALAVLDDAGSERAAVFDVHTALMVCAVAPERVSDLILFHAFARLRYAPDYPWGLSEREVERWTEALPDPSSGDDAPDDAMLLVPSLVGDPDFRAWWRRAGRRGASPTAAQAHLRTLFDNDLRSLLPTISARTLVLHRPRNRVMPVEHGRFVARHIRDSTYVELPGSDFVAYGDDADATLGEIQEFLTGRRRPPAADRVLTTLLFTDIVDSTTQTARLGDEKWRTRLDAHDELVRRELGRFDGTEVNTTGDGFVATFDGPARAIHCAAAICAAVRLLGIDVRVGVHTGEVERRGADITGNSVNLTARICAQASAGDVFVSSTVVELVSGSGIGFTDLGPHVLKGIEQPWRIFSVDRQ
jgi:class 3 adenylate cyclase